MRATSARAMHIVRSEAQHIASLQHLLTPIALLHHLTGFDPHHLGEVMSVDDESDTPCQTMAADMQASTLTQALIRPTTGNEGQSLPPFGVGRST